eukprot:CAMPEP_0117561508 /NCGR_PEP_ID=MMETSP0784-20121206/54455_1 /TAXON_ID=39447 /ORGANISM="" /LENGTH=75 /DNA_ID=CAMNT_0005359005 /DNA_START=126 /DNA_END=353 /DNA_ORIENTATION=+
MSGCSNTSTLIFTPGGGCNPVECVIENIASVVCDMLLKRCLSGPCACYSKTVHACFGVPLPADEPAEKCCTLCWV